jgi:hypothetical protein
MKNLEKKRKSLIKQNFQSIPFLISLNKIGILSFFKNKRIKNKFI